MPLTPEGALLPAAPTPWTSALTIPNDPSLNGFEVYAQFARTDPSTSQGFAFSRGLKLVVGQ